MDAGSGQSSIQLHLNYIDSGCIMIVCKLIGLTAPGKHCASCEVQMKYKRTQPQGSYVLFKVASGLAAAILTQCVGLPINAWFYPLLPCVPFVPASYVAHAYA